MTNNNEQQQQGIKRCSDCDGEGVISDGPVAGYRRCVNCRGTGGVAAPVESASVTKRKSVLRGEGLPVPSKSVPATAAGDPYWNGPIHTYFSLSYSNYLVVNRSILQSMPMDWQETFVGLINQMQDAAGGVEVAQAYEVTAGNDRYVNELSADELKSVGIEEVWDDAEENSEYVRDGETIDGGSHVIVPCPDPVPHYKDYPGIAAMRERMTFSAAPAAGEGREIDRLKSRHVANIKAREEAIARAEQADAARLAAEKRLAELQHRVRVPDGAKCADAWVHNGELIVCGDPHDSEDVDDADAHNCDMMGCTSVSHVVIREPLTAHGTLGIAARLSTAEQQNQRQAEELERLREAVDDAICTLSADPYGNIPADKRGELLLSWVNGMVDRRDRAEEKLDQLNAAGGMKTPEIVAKIDGLRAKASKLPWVSDYADTEYGDEGKGVSQAMYDDAGRVIFDATNSTAVELVDERTEGFEGPEGSLYDKAAAANFDFVEALVNAWPMISERLASAEPDAARWRALFRPGGRVRVLGTSFRPQDPHFHIGVELWSTYPDAGDDNYSRVALTQYADAVAALAASAADKREGE
ncbi:MAG: hypothetical protein QM754_18405 [Tepidisphaeraceae bacterium]